MPQGIPLPRSRLAHLTSMATAYDVANALLLLPMGFVGAWKLAQEGYGYGLLALPVVATFVTILKCRINLRKELAESHVDALEGALHALQQILLDVDSVQIDSVPKVRVTIHVPKPGDQVLVQLLDYIGDQRGGPNTAGRETPANCGIIGAAFSTKKMLSASRDTDHPEDYVRELQMKWHYSESVARKLNQSSMSWLAIPLFGKNERVLAIVYADSVHVNFFTESRVLWALSVSTGIARFVNERLS